MEEEKFPMCARRVCECTTPQQEDAFIRHLTKIAWEKKQTIAGFYEENNSLYMFWPSLFKEQFWNLPVDTGEPFYLDFDEKLETINLFWIIVYSNDQDPIPMAFGKTEEPTHD